MLRLSKTFRKFIPLHSNVNNNAKHCHILKTKKHPTLMQVEYPSLLQMQESIEGSTFIYTLVKIPSARQCSLIREKTSMLKSENQEFAFSSLMNRSFSVNTDGIHNDEIGLGMKKNISSTGFINENGLNRFIGGRIALRRSLIAALPSGHVLEDDFVQPFLSNSSGAPALPANLKGSVSHKENVALGFIVLATSKGFAGCDIEGVQSKFTMQLKNRVLTPSEVKQLRQLHISRKHLVVTGVSTQDSFTASADEVVLLHFSFKEAIFKALHPLLLRQIDFDEVIVTPSDDGSAQICFQLKSQSHSDNFLLRNLNTGAVRSAQLRENSAHEAKLKLSCVALWRRYINDGKHYWLTFVHIFNST